MSELPAALIAVAPALRSRLDEIADRIVERVQRGIPVYRAQTFVSSAELHATAVDNVAYLLRTDLLPDGAELAAARLTGRHRGQVGAPLPELLAGFRIGFTVFWEMLAEEVITSRDVDQRELVALATHVFGKAEEYTAALTAAYRDAAADRLRQREQERSALVEALTTGVPSGHDSIWEIASRLELPNTGAFAMVAAEVPAVGSVALPEIAAKLRAADISSAWRLLPDVEVLLETLETWLATGGSAAETAERLFVHPNTVRHRLRRVAERTGRSLDQPTALAELSTALHALRLLPGVR